MGAQLQFNFGEVCGSLCTSAADKVLNPSICKDTPLSSGLLITAILGDVSPFVKLYFAALDSASERKRKKNPFVGKPNLSIYLCCCYCINLGCVWLSGSELPPPPMTTTFSPSLSLTVKGYS